MRTTVLSLIALVIGCLCVAFTLWEQRVAVSIAAVQPAAAGTMGSRAGWWPLCAAIIRWALACRGLMSYRKDHRSYVA